jgi:subtilisin family serine protease
MKMLQFTICLSLLIILCPVLASAQSGDYYRYVNGRQVSLQPIHDRFMLVYDRTYDRSGAFPVSPEDGEQLYRFEMKNKWYELFESRSIRFAPQIREHAPEVHVSPVFLNEDGREQFASNEILVVFDADTPRAAIERIEQEYNMLRIEDETARWLGDRVLYRLLPPYVFTSLEVANKLYENGGVKKASVNWVFDLEFHSVTPNDTHFGSQWNITKTMLNYAWDITVGSGDVIIAIVDEGVDLEHDDLDDNLLRDGGGNIIGINTTDTGSSNNPHPYEDDAHGTASAGIAAAVGNNNNGVAGASWNSKIMPVRIARDLSLDPNNPQQWTYTAWIVSGIEFAYQNGANIISNSWGGTGHDQDIEDAFDDAANNGAIVIASSGNYYPWNSNPHKSGTLQH